jgi:DNA-binding NtrC family response regulator
MSAEIMIVHEHTPRREALSAPLERAGYRVTQCGSTSRGWRDFVAREPDLVIADWSLPATAGRALVARIRERSDVPFIAVADEASIQSAVSALKAGADDFLCCGPTELEQLASRVAGMLRARSGGAGGDLVDRRLVGASRPIVKLRARIRAVAPLSTAVLIIGEPGSGRDAVARVLHAMGSRGEGNLVAIDCARFRPGRGLPRAEAVYLDGVERLEPSAQAFLADQLSHADRSSEPAGPRILASARPEIKRRTNAPVDVTLRRLLLRFAIELPALREIPEDVPAIADALTHRLSTTMERRTRLSAAAREFLRQRHWPGNVRELGDLLERAVAFCGDRLIRESLLVDLVRELEESVETMRRQQGHDERDVLVAALQESGGNVSRTARQLGRSRGAVYRMIERHGISLGTER